MANPITIGELTDVPAPNSPINAQFHQETANRIVHRFATLAQMNAWAAANGSMAWCAETALHYGRVGGLWVPFALKQTTDQAALGILARGVGVTQQLPGLGAVTPISNCAVAWQASPTRWYRTAALVPWHQIQNAAGVIFRFQIHNSADTSGPLVRVAAANQGNDNVTGSTYLELIESGLSGTINRRLACKNDSGVDVNIAPAPYNAAAFFPHITVEDLGAV